jgi:hypothetical protein
MALKRINKELADLGRYVPTPFLLDIANMPGTQMQTRFRGCRRWWGFA